MRLLGRNFLLIAGLLYIAFGIFAATSGMLNFLGIWVLRENISTFIFVAWLFCGVCYFAVGVLGIIFRNNPKKARMLMFFGFLGLYVYVLSAFVIGNYTLLSLAVMVLVLVIPICFIAGAHKNQSQVAVNDWGYIFISPFFLVFLAFIAYPIYNTFYMSFTDATLRGGVWHSNYVGLDNFRELLQNEMFRSAISNTWMIWIFNFIPQMILAFVLAAMFTSTTYKLRGTGFFKVMYFLPNLMMPVTIAALFNVYLALHGPLNQFLVGTLGVMDTARDFTMYPVDVRIVVIFLQTWIWFGQTAIVLVAGMTAISPTFYESAMIDGANQVKMFFKITLPLLKPVILFVLVTSLVGGLGMFDIPLLFTGNPFGNPQNAVLTINMFMNVRRSFPGLMFGSAASVSVLLFTMSSLVALVVFWSFRTKNEDEVAEREARKIARRAAKEAKAWKA